MAELTPVIAQPPEPVRKVRADAMRRADQAWRLRVSGAGWDDVAAAVGYANGENAMRAVRTVYDCLPRVERDQLRAIWRERLEVLWRHAASDAEDRRPGAIVSAVRVAQAAMRLDGLDAPLEVVAYNPTETEIDAWIAEVSKQRVPQVEEPDIFGEPRRGNQFSQP